MIRADELVEHAAHRCCDNPYYAFHKPAGTSLICIEGDWSNLVDAQIKGRVAVAMGVDANSPYSPLYARAVGMPRPWGVTALFAEYTGAQPPLEVDWSLERGVRTTVPVAEPIAAAEAPPAAAESPAPVKPRRDSSGEKVVGPPRARAFTTFWEFAVALNRSDPAALALAHEGAASDIPVDKTELRRLLGMMWFRTVLDRLPRDWRERLLQVLIEGATVPDHAIKRGRQTIHLRELGYEELEEIGSTTAVPDWIRPDLDLLIAVGRFWGAEAVKRFHFAELPGTPRTVHAGEPATQVPGLIVASIMQPRRRAELRRVHHWLVPGRFQAEREVPQRCLCARTTGQGDVHDQDSQAPHVSSGQRRRWRYEP